MCPTRAATTATPNPAAKENTTMRLTMMRIEGPAGSAVFARSGKTIEIEIAARRVATRAREP
jgi:hypothetical protein